MHAFIKCVYILCERTGLDGLYSGGSVLCLASSLSRGVLEVTSAAGLMSHIAVGLSGT